MTFSERRVSADGFDLRVLEAGWGPPLVYLHGAGGLHLTSAHDLLAGHHRVVAFELPGFGASPQNSRTASFDELAATMRLAVAAAGIDGGYTLTGTSFGGATALHMALAEAEAPPRPEFWGGPATVLRQLRESRQAIGWEILDGLFTMPHLPYAKAHRSLELFVKEVVPGLRAAGTA
ncbi:MAG TPA: alpha/beta fold hydrolase [Actinomycetota bacterium]